MIADYREDPIWWINSKTDETKEYELNLAYLHGEYKSVIKDNNIDIAFDNIITEAGLIKNSEEYNTVLEALKTELKLVGEPFNTLKDKFTR